MDTLAHITRADFRAWAERQPRGRFERVDGRVVPMTPERIVHVELKAAVLQALKRAIRDSGAECRAYGDGVTVEIDDDTDYQPDAVVNAGEPPSPDALAAPNPIIVVEVLSPGTSAIDTGDKLAGYFRVASIRHYLIVSARRRQVTHHRRDGAAVTTTIVTGGALALEPPGVSITVDEFYADVTL